MTYSIHNEYAFNNRGWLAETTEHVSYPNGECIDISFYAIGVGHAPGVKNDNVGFFRFVGVFLLLELRRHLRL